MTAHAKTRARTDWTKRDTLSVAKGDRSIAHPEPGSGFVVEDKSSANLCRCQACGAFAWNNEASRAWHLKHSPECAA